MLFFFFGYFCFTDKDSTYRRLAGGLIKARWAQNLCKITNHLLYPHDLISHVCLRIIFVIDWWNISKTYFPFLRVLVFATRFLSLTHLHILKFVGIFFLQRRKIKETILPVTHLPILCFWLICVEIRTIHGDVATMVNTFCS